ncbi:hypothetical protein AAD001_15705 [Colwelliaceae bacterium 6471]
MFSTSKLTRSLLLLAVIHLPALATTEEDPFADESWGDNSWAEESAQPWKLNGFIEAGQGTFLQNNVVNSDSSLSEINARLDFSYQHELFDFTAKGDLRYDDVLADTFWQTRELNVAFSPLSYLDVKLGRQVLTWGTGDYLFLNDLFPKDWQSFFSGRDDEYLKAASDSLRTSWYFSNITLDLAYTPDFTPDNYITGERFSFFSPQWQDNIAPASQFKVDQTNNEQWSARLASNYQGIEYALYGYHGFWTTPVGVNSIGMPYFPRLNSWGASVRMPIGDGIFNSEFSIYNSSEDGSGTSPLIANGQRRFLIGYEQELIKNLTASVQYYVEQTKDYQAFKASSSLPDQLVDEYRQLLTLRLRYMALQQKLVASVFAFYSPTDSDAYIKPSINYRYNDNWSYAVGANLFTGKDDFSFFGQHQNNTNVWARVRFQF